MQVSFLETARYQVPPKVPAGWPVPPAVYDPDVGAQAYQGMVDRMLYVEELGFDWISVSEHHYSPRILRRILRFRPPTWRRGRRE